LPTPREGESEQQFISRCMAYPDMQKYPQEQRAAICYSYWRGEKLHPTFERIIGLFFKRYKVAEATQKFSSFITKNGLNPSKAYNPDVQFKESFEWIEPLIRPYKEDREAKYYLITALTADISMNNVDYGPENRLAREDSSMNWRPVNINHDHSKWLPYPRTRVDFSAANEFSLEATLRVDNQDKWLQRKLDKGDIVHPSIEGRPHPISGRYHFTGLALLEKGIELPGSPLSEIVPLVFNESVGKSVCEFKGGKMVCEFESKEVKNNLKESVIKETIKEVLLEQARTDAERAKAHFNISDEEWNKLSDEEKQAYIDKLPPRGSAEMREQEGEEPVPETPKESPPEKDTQPPVPHECQTGWHWDDAKQQCVPDESGDSAATPMTKLPGPKAVLAEQDVPHECATGYHWSDTEQNCVPDEVGDSNETPMTKQTSATSPPKPVALIVEQEIPHDCPAGQHWSDEEQACVDDVEPFTEEQVPPATNAPSTVAADDTATCPEGQHWDPDLNKCVDDVLEECEAGWHFDVALQKCVPDNPQVNERKTTSDLRLENAKLRVDLIHTNDKLKDYMATIQGKNRVIVEKNLEIAKYLKANAMLEGRITEKQGEVRKLEMQAIRLNKEAQDYMKRNHNLGRDVEDKNDKITMLQESVQKISKNRDAVLKENQKLVEENLQISSDLTEIRNKEVQWNKDKKDLQEGLTKALKHQKYVYEFLKNKGFEIVAT
jgi:hypothetical protein